VHAGERLRNGEDSSLFGRLRSREAEKLLPGTIKPIRE